MLENIFILMLLEMYKYNTSYILLILLAIKQIYKTKINLQIEYKQYFKTNKIQMNMINLMRWMMLYTETKLPLVMRPFRAQIHRSQFRSALKCAMTLFMSP